MNVEKQALISLIDDDPSTLITILGLTNKVDIRLSLKDLEIPPILCNSPPLISVAIYLNAKKCISSLLIYHSNLNIVDDKGRAPIHFASAFGLTYVLDLLDKEGANMTAVDIKGKNILHYAASFDRVVLFKWIISKKYNLEMKDGKWFTPLHFAVERKNLDLVNYILINNIIEQTPNKNGWTPILLAAKNNLTEIFKALVQHGGNCNLKNIYFRNLIYILSFSCLLFMFDVLFNILKFHFIMLVLMEIKKF